MKTTAHLEIADFWQMLDNPPAGCEDVATLYSWGYNETHSTFLVFLTLSGIAEDLGVEDTRLSHRLGYLEMHYLADALEAYATRPDLVRAYVSNLINWEMEQ